MTDTMTLARQLLRQHAHALASPAQRRHRITTRRRLHQLLQRRAQIGIALRHGPPPRPRASHPSLRGGQCYLGRSPQFLYPGRDGRSRQSNRSRDRAHPAIAQSASFRRRPQPTHLFVHHAAKQLEFLGNARFITAHVLMLGERVLLVKVIY